MSNYLRVFAVVLLVSVGGIALFNAVVDPYAILRWVRYEGFNDPKARPEVDILQIKIFAAVGSRPDALILGNSRAEVGLDPAHESWARHSLRAYNIAAPGSDLQDSLQALTTMCLAGRYRYVLVGLDFQDFLVASDRGPASPETLVDVPPKRLHPSVLDILRAVGTSGAIVDSIRTLLAQFQKYPEILTSAGFNPLLDYVPMARNSGYYPLFQQRLVENARTYLRKPKSVHPTMGGESAAEARLRLLVRKANACSDKVDLIIYPYHSQMLLLFGEVGLWPAFEEWKRSLARIVHEENGYSARAQRVRLLDFASFSEAARQPSPRPGHRRQESPWYWESGHFKKELGDQMLLLLLCRTGEAPHRPLAMIELRPTMVDAWLATVRSQNGEFRREHPDEVEIVRGALGQLRGH